MANREDIGGWPAGTSGNPNGRPPVSRALSGILERAGGRRLKGPDGKSREARELVAQSVWELAATGRVELAGGRPLEVEGVREWLSVVGWIFERIEGKPKASAALGDLRDGALLVPEDPGEPFRFTLDLGDAARGSHRRPEANGQPPHAGEALDKKQDPS
jgi:hypothetical protein